MSYDTWQREYAGDPSVIGSTFWVNTKAVTVVGIAPQGFYGDRMSNTPPDYYLPIESMPVVAGVAAFFVLYQQLENYVISPRVMRDAVQMPAVAVLLAALLGGSVLGLIGALMAIPVAAAIRVIAAPVLRARDEEPTEPPTEEPAAPRTSIQTDA